MTHDQDSLPAPASETPLQGWKEIALYLERDERTARRWETEEGLPIRRHRTDRRSSVYAYPSEIEVWRATRPPKAESINEPAPAPPAPPSRPWLWGAAVAVFVLGAFVLFLRSPGIDPVAQAGAAPAGVRTTEICSHCDWIGGPSPDGRYLSETEWAKSGEISIRDLETGELRRLGERADWEDWFGEADTSLFSPDGKRIAYTWLTDRDGEPGREIRVIDAFGDKPKWRTVYYNPEHRFIEPNAWTTDGRLMVWFQRRDWSVGLGFVSLADGKLSVVKSLHRRASRAMLSPDARWIVYDTPTNEGAPERDIHLLAADGSAERQVTTHKANDFAMGFAPDSRTLLFASNRTGSYSLWGVEISTEGAVGDPKMLMRDLGSVYPMGVLPNGALVYGRAMGSEDLLSAEVDMATGRLLNKPKIIETKFQGSNLGPWLSPDGARFAYFASPGAARGGRGELQQLIVHDRSSGEEQVVATGDLSLNGYYGLAWSPDGKQILLPARDELGRWALYEADLQANKTRKLVDQNEQARPQPIGWLRDGQTILFGWESPEIRDGGSEKTIMRLGPNDAEPQRIYTSRARIGSAAISPQRDRIAWSELGGPINVMPIEGGKVRVLHQSSSWVKDMAWTPDGSALLLNRREGSDGSSAVWLLPLDGSVPRKTELAAEGMRHLSMHADGKTVFYKAGRPDTRIFKTENYLPSSGGTTE